MINVLLVDDMNFSEFLIRDPVEQYPDVRVIGNREMTLKVTTSLAQSFRRRSSL